MSLVTELCPYCEREITLDWDVNKKGYEAECTHCKKKLLLCSECLNSPDNPAQICNTEGDHCFRTIPSYKLEKPDGSLYTRFLLSEDPTPSEWFSLGIITRLIGKNIVYERIISEGSRPPKEKYKEYLDLSNMSVEDTSYNKSLYKYKGQNVVLKKSRFRMLWDRYFVTIIADLLGESDLIKTNDIWMNKYAHIKKQVTEKIIVPLELSENKVEFTLLTQLILSSQNKSTIPTICIENCDNYSDMRMMSSAIDTLNSCIIQESKFYKECAYCCGNLGFGETVENGTHYTCPDCNAELLETPVNHFENAKQNREVWKSNDDSGFKDDFIKDEMGGFHSCSIGHSPDGKFCGECTMTTCRGCNVATQN